MNAQTVLLNYDKTNEVKPSIKGPNLKKFAHVIFRAGFLVDEDKPGARIIYGPSVNLAIGVRRKYKITSFYSLGYDVESQYTVYKLKQKQGKILPDTILNNVVGRMDYSTIGLGFYNRFNFDPGRGNFLGTFLDIGIMGTFDFSVKSISKNKQDDGTIVKTIIRLLPYVNNLNSKVYARLGYSHIALYASYRITDLFKSSFNYPDLPRLVIGIELAAF
jgi:hypothetical protein